MTTVETFDMAAIDPIMFGSEEFSDDTTDFIRKAMEESAIPYEVKIKYHMVQINHKKRFFFIFFVKLKYLFTSCK